jgi:hypothetical protein
MSNSRTTIAMIVVTAIIAVTATIVVTVANAAVMTANVRNSVATVSAPSTPTASKGALAVSAVPVAPQETS